MSLKTYDPNLATNLKSVHVLEVTFQAWDCRAVHRAEVGGNCRGFENFETALGMIYDALPSAHPLSNGGDIATLILTNEAGDTLECQDEDGIGEEFLQRYVVGVRVLSVDIRP